MNTAYIRTNRLIDNFYLLSKKKKDFCVVKADAYGHGFTDVTAALYAAGARRFAVSDGADALTLLRLFPDATVLLLGTPDFSLWVPLLSAGAIFSVSDDATAARLSALAARKSLRARVHIACNSGMNRMGFSLAPADYDASLTAIRLLLRDKNLQVDGIYTHFAVSPPDPLYATAVTRFEKALSDLSPDGDSLLVHAAATPNLFTSPKIRRRAIARIGLGLYGYGAPGVRPVMQVRSSVLGVFTLRASERVGYGGDYTLTEDVRSAVIGIGYADGLPRLADGAFFKSGNACLPILGRISMNQTTVGIGDVPLSVGDTVTVLGEDGAELLALAEASGRIPYEILMMGSRMRRILLEH